jgi:hypothetical protein
VQDDNIPEQQQERQARVDELVAEHGAPWLDTFRPGSFGCHELLDRTMVAAGMVDQYVLSHPACVRDPEWFALARQASAALAELYQRVGAIHLSVDDASS